MTSINNMLEELAVSLVEQGRAKAAQDLVNIALARGYLDAPHAAYVLKRVRHALLVRKVTKQVHRQVDQEVANGHL